MDKPMTETPPEDTEGVTVKPDIARVMADDPMNHTRADIKMLIDYLRSVRHTFNAGPKIKAKPVSKAKKAATLAAGKIDLSSLGLDI